MSLDEVRKGPFGDDSIRIAKKLVEKGLCSFTLGYYVSAYINRFLYREFTNSLYEMHSSLQKDQ